jgi:Xaa-Pro dipeptidase
MQGILGVQGIYGIPQPLNEPPFTLAERDRRWTRIRGLMAEQAIDVLVIPNEWLTSDSLYIADTTGVTIFPREGEPTLIVGGEASNLAIRQPGWIEDRLSAAPLGSTAVHYGELTARVLRDHDLLGDRIAVAGLRGHTLASVRQPEGYASYSTVLAISQAARHPIVDGTPVLAEARYVKSEEEIARLAASVRVAERAVEAMVHESASGVAQAEVFGQMLLAEVRAGADELHLAWCPGRWAEHRHRYVTTPPGRLEPGVYVSVELMPEIRGYQAQVAQPLVVGSPADRALEIFELNAAAFDLACRLLRPGARWGEVEREVRSLADGTPYELTLLLHGRGLGNDGPLLIPSGSHRFAAELRVAENTTFVLKPFALPRDAESRSTRAFDVTWGDTIVIRPGGAERLGSRERALPVRA